MSARRCSIPITETVESRTGPRGTVTRACGKPALTKYKGALSCWGCRDRLEQQEEQEKRDARAARR